ncbi:CoA-disulfide reductase, partial [Schumannella luteola]
VARAARDAGVALHLGTEAVAIDEDAVRLADGSVLPAELVIAALGVRPESWLARRAGLELGASG